MAASRLLSFDEKIMKPSCPTPLSLRRYNLCRIDQFIPHFHMAMAAFYPFPSKKPQEISDILEKSLSKVLSSYYPFAGRLKDNIFVDCNDQGAKFINVRYNCPMSEVVNLPDTSPECLPFPKGITRIQDEENLLIIQLSHFNCGGLALSVNLSHKIADGCTLCNFFSDWASIARDHNANIPSPQMIGSSIFPPSTDTIQRDTTVDEIDNTPLENKRYVFSNSKLEMLKAQVASETGIQNPTRVEVLSALIYKCATAGPRVKPSVLILPVNLRPIFNPPIPTRVIGNIFSLIRVPTMMDDEITVAGVVRELRKAKDELKKEDNVKNNNMISISSELSSMANEVELHYSTSLCNYPLNNLDFGWGKPSRVTMQLRGHKNGFLFMDNQRGDGIEVIGSLPQKNVTQFEDCKEFKEFASPITNHN